MLPSPQAKKSDLLSQSQVDLLKSTGMVGVIGSEPKFKIEEYKDIEFVFNASDAKVHVADILLLNGERGFFFNPRSLVYMPHFATTEEVMKSVALRTAVIIQGTLKVVRDPTKEISESDLEPHKPLGEVLTKGEYRDDSYNAFDQKLDEVIDEEEAHIQRAKEHAGLTGAKRRARQMTAKQT